MGLFDFFFGSKQPTSRAGADKVRPKFKGKKVDLKKRFELYARSGQGSMSKVWRAYDRTLGRTVALKILDKEKTAKFEARFVGRNKPSEGEICLALNHPNIVKTYEYGFTSDNEPFMSMEWIEGVGLNFLVETKSPGLQRKAIDYLTQICDALAYMHGEKYMHRDLCPRNVMVTNEGQVKLIDFGLTIPYTPLFCEPGNRTGTPDYLAPEIIKRQPTDHRVDLFALGVTAYEVFTNNLPWPQARGSMDILLKHLRQPPRDPREFKPKMDDRTRALILKSIEREPKDRFQSAAEMREALAGLPPWEE